MKALIPQGFRKQWSKVFVECSVRRIEIWYLWVIRFQRLQPLDRSTSLDPAWPLTAMLFTNARYFTTAFATLKTNRRQMDIPKSSSPQTTPRSIGFNVALKENLQVSKHGCGIFQLFRGKQHKHLFSIMFRPFSARSRHPSDASTKASAAEGRKPRMQSLININLTWASGDK